MVISGKQDSQIIDWKNRLQKHKRTLIWGGIVMSATAKD
jgi:hypothetical protein